MVITPQQANEKALRVNQRTLRAAEKTIDAALAEDFKKGELDGVCIDAALLGANDGNVLAVIKERYGQAGWTVKYENDQREGDYLKFKAKRGAR